MQSSAYGLHFADLVPRHSYCMVKKDPVDFRDQFTSVFSAFLVSKIYRYFFYHAVAASDLDVGALVVASGSVDAVTIWREKSRCAIPPLF